MFGFSKIFVFSISDSKKNSVRYYHKMHISLHAQHSSLSSAFKETANFLERFSKNTQISDFMKILSVGAELFHVDRGKTVGRTDRGK